MIRGSPQPGASMQAGGRRITVQNIVGDKFRAMVHTLNRFTKVFRRLCKVLIELLRLSNIGLKGYPCNEL